MARKVRKKASGRPEPEKRASAWNRFFFAARDPRMCNVIRIGYSALLLINLLVWAPNLERWFGDHGALPLDAARAIETASAWTLLAHVPLWVCYGALVAQTILLAVGWHPRIQAIGVLIWLSSFHNRDILVIDGEDTLFRMFAFYIALMPDPRRDKDAVPWALRLMQIQMCVVYLSSAIEKSTGHDWTSGTALYYVSRLDDSFGKLPVPAFAFDTIAIVKLMTWGVLALEWLLPFALLHPRTRKYAVCVGIAFHLSIEWTMNLFLFHWIMILGLLSFLEWDELVIFVRRAARRKAPG